MRLPKEGRTALVMYTVGQGSGVLLQFLVLPFTHAIQRTLIIVLFSVAIQIVMIYCFRTWIKVALCSAGLSVVSTLGLSLIFLTHPWPMVLFGLYLMLMCFFHWSEYMSVAITNPSKLKLDSFLLNHSVEYWLAAVASWTEFALELLLIPSIKSSQFWLLSLLGFSLCAFGEIVRKGAMVTAGTNFTHVIAVRHCNRHCLVTHGVYSWCRHPAYVGWLAWSVGTQMLLVNPICSVAYAVISWNFFDQRIYGEEMTLINFFGEDYVRYQKQVPTGIPFIRGFVPLDDQI